MAAFPLRILDVNLVDEGVPALLLHEHLRPIALVRAHIVFLNRLEHGRKAVLDLPRIIARAITGEEKFQDE